MDWLDLLVVQVILKSLPQHYSSRASSAFRLPYGPILTSYMTAGKTIVVTIQTFVDKGIIIKLSKCRFLLYEASPTEQQQSTLWEIVCNAEKATCYKHFKTNY